MKHQPLDIYDDMPRGMRSYLSSYGWHFNRKAFDLAVSGMRRKSAVSGKTEPLEVTGKEKVEEMLVKYGVKLENCVMYDAAYVYNMGMADYMKSSIPDESHLVLYVRDVLDDVDGSDELPFRFWLQKRIALGEGIEWDDLL